MERLAWIKTAGLIVVFFVATAIAGSAQTFPSPINSAASLAFPLSAQAQWELGSFHPSNTDGNLEQMYSGAAGWHPENMSQKKNPNAPPRFVDIIIVLRGNEAIPTGEAVRYSPDGEAIIGLDPGETVRYSSPDGKATVEFKDYGSPYDVDVVEDGQIVRVRETRGSFYGRCYVIPPGSTERIGWRPGSTLSGAEHEIPRPGSD